jgi:hypothetical protein
MKLYRSAPMSQFEIWTFRAMTPIFILLAWGIYLGATWIAAFITHSALNQAMMGIIAVVIVIGVILQGPFEVD